MTVLEIILLVLLIAVSGLAFYFWRLASAWRAEALKWHAANRAKASAAVALLATFAGLLILRRLCASETDAEPAVLPEGGE